MLHIYRLCVVLVELRASQLARDGRRNKRRKKNQQKYVTMFQAEERVQEIVVCYELGAQEQSTGGEDKQLLERLTGLADQLVAIGDYSILLSYPVYNYYNIT